MQVLGQEVTKIIKLFQVIVLPGLIALALSSCGGGGDSGTGGSTSSVDALYGQTMSAPGWSMSAVLYDKTISSFSNLETTSLLDDAGTTFVYEEPTHYIYSFRNQAKQWDRIDTSLFNFLSDGKVLYLLNGGLSTAWMLAQDGSLAEGLYADGKWQTRQVAPLPLAPPGGHSDIYGVQYFPNPATGSRVARWSEDVVDALRQSTSSRYVSFAKGTSAWSPKVTDTGDYSASFAWLATDELLRFGLTTSREIGAAIQDGTSWSNPVKLVSAGPPDQYTSVTIQCPSVTALSGRRYALTWIESLQTQDQSNPVKYSYSHKARFALYDGLTLLAQPMDVYSVATDSYFSPSSCPDRTFRDAGGGLTFVYSSNGVVRARRFVNGVFISDPVALATVTSFAVGADAQGNVRVIWSGIASQTSAVTISTAEFRVDANVWANINTLWVGESASLSARSLAVNAVGNATLSWLVTRSESQLLRAVHGALMVRQFERP